MRCPYCGAKANLLSLRPRTRCKSCSREFLDERSRGWRCLWDRCALVGFFIQGTSLMPWQRWLAILINVAVWIAIGKLFLTTRKLNAPAGTETSENK